MSSGLELILNASTGTPVGGVNTARVQNDVGDLCLWSSNFAGMRIAAGSGNVSMSGALNVTGQLTASNVSVLGTTEIINAYETHSSNVVINNYGTGPALSVTQTETTAQPVAAFYAGSSNALFVTSAGQVGIGKSTASYALDVSGSVNVSGYVKNGNCAFLLYGGGASLALGGYYVGYYTNVLYNIGSQYNTINNSTNHGFTAPVNGVYIFCANAPCIGGHWIAITKNRPSSGAVFYGLTQSQVGTISPIQTNTSSVIPCAAGDIIQVYTDTSAIADANSWFSGALLFGT